MKKLMCILASAVLFGACEQKTETVVPPADKKTENNTTVINPPANTQKTEKNTTVINPPANTQKTESTTTTSSSPNP